APAHVEAHVDATRDGFMLYEVRGRRDAHRGYIPQAHVAAVRRVDEKITDTAQALARLGRTPHYHLEHLLILEEAAGFNPCHQGGGGSTDIARLDAIALGLGEVYLNVHLWLVDLGLRMHISNTGDLRDGLPHLLGLAPQNVQLDAEDAD